MAVRLIILLLLTVILFPQNKDNKIKEFNKNLSDIKNEIDILERDLSQKKRQEKKSLSDLEKINKQSMLLARLLNTLREEEIYTQERIDELNLKIQNLGTNINDLKANYSKYIQWVYKHNSRNELDYILNARNVEQAIYRMKYFNSISVLNGKRIDGLIKNLFTYTALSRQFEDENQLKKELYSRKKTEQSELERKKNEKKNLISSLKKDKKNIEQEIRQKRINELAIKNIIAKLIEEERKVMTDVKARRTTDKTAKIPAKYDYSNLTGFAQLQGRMMWPVRSGKIYRKFGINRNEKLNTETPNYGVDIQTAGNADIYAVAEGFISAVSWIPGYGSVVIISHKDKYRTVYGNIMDISVSEGQKVKAGNIIGKVNNSLEGNIVHFEIWNERHNQNPENWLK